MIDGSRRRVDAARAREAEDALRRRALETEIPALELHAGGFDVIAEVKRRAPSVGPLTGDESRSGEWVAGRADAYVRGGAAAISVLTEPDRFGGTLTDVSAAARAVPMPVMRKDFVVDPYQVIEARAAGAGGVLVIVRVVDDAQAREMLDAATELSLFVLLECFDRADVDRAGTLVDGHSGSNPLLVGVNTRNLATLEVDRDRLADLAPHLPPGLPAVAESGITTPEHARDAVALGYTVALIGSALMQADNPAQLTAAMLKTGRTEAQRQCSSE